jgi:cyclophilin family peptidyl-prolyl cis-trans isomerase
MPNVIKPVAFVQRMVFYSLVWTLSLVSCSAFGQTPNSSSRTLVEVRTELGTMVIALYNETPEHRDNFLKLVREGAYNGLLFHQVIKGFIIQGGDPDSRDAKPGEALGMGGADHTLPAEIVPGLVHTRGALAAVRSGVGVNPEKRSNAMQFYIVDGRTYTAEELDRVAQRSARLGEPVTYTQENKLAYARDGGAPQLDGAYTVFGQVVDGEAVIDAIVAVACDGRDRPMEDIRMFMRIVE